MHPTVFIPFAPHINHRGNSMSNPLLMTKLNRLRDMLLSSIERTLLSEGKKNGCRVFYKVLWT